MAIEAPVSKTRIMNLKIYIGACILFAAIFAYDGYLSKYPWSMRQGFYQKHKDDDTMKFNRIAPLFVAAGAVVLACRLWMLKGIKLVADEKELIVSKKMTIPYDSIVKIDKTRFNDKGGFFLITYKSEQNTEKQVKISDRKYDNLSQVLDRLIEKIS
jgi:hypothetical protein